MALQKVRLYDTYQGKVRDFVPVVPGEVSCYYCGPTVYNYVHIGNIRPVLVFDLLNRLFVALGYKVHMVSNYTDIDDKIIKKALEEGKSEKELTDFYIKAYEDVLARLHCLPLEDHPRVSDYIPQISDFVAKLMENGFAYRTPSGDIEYDVEKDPTYGDLSKTDIHSLQSGARIETDGEKKSPLDFALWKLTDDKGIKFDMPIGRGRPGWHTECVVMIKNHFKKPVIDIHGGGFDLKFPHHENEMAQSYAYDGTLLANYWMHVGFLNMNGDKMSKSLGNVVLAKDALDRFGGNVLREFFLTTYYRAPINYTDEALTTAEAEVEKFKNLLAKFESKAGLEGWKLEGEFSSEEYGEFLNWLADDLNVANALTVLNKVSKEANVLLRNPRAKKEDLSKAYLTYRKMLDTLGFDFPTKTVSEEDQKLYRDYQDARAAKDYARSDELRKSLQEKGLL